MATFDWTKFNHKVVIKSTKKRMFGRFYYTVKYFCPGGRIIHSDGDIPASILERQMLHRHFNYGGSWRATRERIDEIDSAQLEAFRSIKDQHQDQIRLRVEEPYITVYAETEEKLVELANTILKDWRGNINTVTRTTAAEKAILDRNCIIARTDPGYKYKIVLRDGTFKNKVALCGYLEQIKDQIRVSDGVWRNLEKPYPFIWGAWIYANDPDIATMLNIIEAGIVSNIHEIVVVDKYSNCQTIEI